jgi:hypothetical protein
VSALDELIAQAADEDDTDTAETVRYVFDMLGTTLTLAGNRRVKMLPLEWAELTPAECVASLRAIRHVIAAEREAHPDAILHFELSATPPYVVEFMDAVVRADPRITYAEVPDLSG